MTPLDRHHARSLAQLARIRAGFAVLGLIGWLFAGASGAFWMIPILIATVLIVLGIVVALERGYSPDLIGLISAIVDGLVLAAMPVLFYWAEPDAPTAFLLKNDEALFGLVACALQAYTMRPIYPILVGILYGFAHVVLFAWAFDTGDVHFTASWVEVRTTGSVHLAGLLFNHLAIVPAAAVLMSLVAWSGSRLIGEAVEHERRTAALSRYFSPRIAARRLAGQHPRTADVRS